MARPHPVILDVLRGGGGSIDGAAVDSAIEHRVFGLVWSAVETGRVDIDAGARSRLALVHLAEISAHRRQWNALGRAVDTLESSGIRVAAMKGVAAEGRFFDRLGERPSVDIDLVVEDPSRFADAVRLLHPGHPMETSCERAVQSGVIQSLDLLFDGVPIDLHVDPMKLGVEWRGRHRWWATTERIDRPDGGTVEVFGAAATLVQMLIHIGRDRFRYLSTLEETRRISRVAEWREVAELAEMEGVLEPVTVAARVVMDELGGKLVPPINSWRFLMWQRLWRADTRLQGRLGELRYLRRAQWLLPLTARGRTWEALSHIGRTVFPPKELVSFRHGDGPYFARLIGGRISVIWRRRLAAARLARH